MSNILRWMLAALLILPAVPLLAQATEKEKVTDIADVSLEDMLNQEISVAGKTAQKISEAPAIISVITAEDIKNMGATSLYEVLSYVPGINLTETYYGYTSVSFRGNLQTNYNNKSLLLINDHPMYETIVGSYYLEQVPVGMIKRIEIIRGPGSTLYGTNAFAGVIKIVTKEGADLKGGELSMLAGSHGVVNPRFAFGREYNGFQYSFGAEMMDSKGYDFTVAKDEDGRSGVIDYENDVASGMGSASYKGLRLNLGYFYNRKDKFGVVPTLVSTGERELRGFFADVSYQWVINKVLTLDFLTYYDRLSKDEFVAWYPPLYAQQAAGVGEPSAQVYTGSKNGLNIQGTCNLPYNTRVIGGFFFEYQRTTPYLWLNNDTRRLSSFKAWAFLDEHSTHDTSGYIQLDTKLFDRLGLVGGLRFNHNRDYGNKVTPRAGVVFALTKDVSLKVLYGQAFRNPNFFEKHVETVNVLDGDPFLQPEEISTLDVGLDWMINPSNNLRINYFYLTTDSLITRSKLVPAGELGNTRPTPQYGNSPGQTISGVEAEVKGSFLKKLFYFTNLSYTTGTENNNDADIMFIPHVLVNAGFNWKFTEACRLSPYLQFTGKKEGSLAKGTPVTVESYFLVNLNFEYRISRNFQFMIIGKNLTNQEYFYPEYIRRVIPETPGGPKATVYGRLICNF